MFLRHHGSPLGHLDFTVLEVDLRLGPVGIDGHGLHLIEVVITRIELGESNGLRDFKWGLVAKIQVEYALVEHNICANVLAIGKRCSDPGRRYRRSFDSESA